MSYLAKISDHLAGICVIFSGNILHFSENLRRCPGAGRAARNRTGSGLDGDGPGGAGRRNVPNPERTTDSVVHSGGDMGVGKVSEKLPKIPTCLAKIPTR